MTIVRSSEESPKNTNNQNILQRNLDLTIHRTFYLENHHVEKYVRKEENIPLLEMFVRHILLITVKEWSI